MEDLRRFAEIVHDSEFRLQRRVNMMGQHLTNSGYEGVKVTISVKIEATNNTGTITKEIGGTYKAYQPGVGGVDVGGQGFSTGAGGQSQPYTGQPNSQGLPSSPGGRQMTPRPSAWNQGGGGGGNSNDD